MNKSKILSIVIAALLVVTMTIAITPAFAAEGDITVTWSVDGTTSTTTVASGAVPAKPANPTKVGYVFKGWGLSDTSEAVLGSLPAVYAETTFYAKFTPLQYIITWVYYDTYGILQTKTTTADYGAVPTEPSTPTVVNGSQFMSWDKTIVAATGDATYTAVYNHAQYIVKYIAQISETEIIEEEIYASGVVDVSEYDAPEKPGYGFKGWSTKKDDRDKLIDEKYRVKADTTLYAIYTINATAWFKSIAWYWQALIITALVVAVGAIVILILKRIGVIGK